MVFRVGEFFDAFGSAPEVDTQGDQGRVEVFELVDRLFLGHGALLDQGSLIQRIERSERQGSRLRCKSPFCSLEGNDRTIRGGHGPHATRKESGNAKGSGRDSANEADST